jgi:hypothetical protein
MIYGWMHIAEMGNWREVVDEQDKLVESSGLMAETAHIFRIESQDLARGENPTLLKLWEWANQNPGHLVWYIHTKGVSRPEDENARLWRHYLQYFVIERWRDCRDALLDHDACGVDWTDGPDWVVDAWGGTTGRAARRAERPSWATSGGRRPSASHGPTSPISGTALIGMLPSSSLSGLPGQK